MSRLTNLSLLVGYASDQCQWTFDHYVPSSWETYWLTNIQDLQTKVCPTLAQSDHLNKSIRALETIIALQKTMFNPLSSIDQSDELFSKMYYRSDCPVTDPSSELVSQNIEPLIGLLRDPLTICTHRSIPANLQISGDEQIQSKRFFLLGPSAPYENFRSGPRSIAPWLYQSGSQKILFDIGSTYFNGGPDLAAPTSLTGARWFYEYFQSIQLQFDRIVAFEFASYPPRTYWNQIPDDIIGRLTFINTGVEKAGKFNPWNILTSIAKPNDYVAVKLDIDTPALENELVRQILANTSISSLIDELFFEMHISVNEMRPYWGSPPGDLRDSYLLFTQLRERGIRMHSWP